MLVLLQNPPDRGHESKHLENRRRYPPYIFPYFLPQKSVFPGSGGQLWYFCHGGLLISLTPSRCPQCTMGHPRKISLLFLWSNFVPSNTSLKMEGSVYYAQNRANKNHPFARGYSTSSQQGFFLVRRALVKKLISPNGKTKISNKNYLLRFSDF